MIFQALKAKVKSFLPSTRDAEETISDPSPGLKGFMKEVQIHHETEVVDGKQVVVCIFKHSPTGVTISVFDSVFNLMPDHKREGVMRMLKDKVDQVKCLQKKRDGGKHGRAKET